MAPRHERQRSGQFLRRVHVVDIDQGRGELRAVRTHYEILGVAQTASDAELRTAYRRLLRQAHPDMGGSSAILDLVNEAYDALKDPVKRSQYDATLRQGTSTAESVSTTPRQTPRTSQPHEPPPAPPFGRFENRPSATGARTTYTGVPRSRSGRVPQWVVDEALGRPPRHSVPWRGTYESALAEQRRSRERQRDTDSAGVTDGDGGRGVSCQHSSSWRSWVPLRGCSPAAL